MFEICPTQSQGNLCEFYDVANSNEFAR